MPKKKKNPNIPKSVAMLASGVAVAQFTAIAASPILTRLYSPDDFGIFAVFTTILVVLSAISELNYRFVIPIAENEKKASYALFLSLSSVILISSIITILVWMFRFDIAKALNIYQLADYLWLIPLAVLVDTVFVLSQLWSIRAKAFKRISWAQGSQGIAAISAQITMGFFNIGALGLIVGKMLGSLFGLIMLKTPVIREVKPNASNFSLSYMFLMAKEYYKFPLYKAPSSFIGVISRRVAFFLFPVFFGPAVTGLYALTYRVLHTPGIFIGTQIQRVFLSTAAESRRTGELTASSRLMYRALLQIGLPSFALFGLIAPEVFSLVFGDNWREGGVYVQWLIPYIFLSFVGAPFSVLPMVYDKQQVDLAFQGLLFTGQGIAIVIAGLWYDAIVAVALLSLVGSILRACYLTWAMSLAGHSWRVVFGDLAQEFVYAIPFLAPTVIALGLFIEPISTGSTLAIAVASMLLLAIVLFFRLKRLFSA